MAQNDAPMVPHIGDTDVEIPITIEYNGGRSTSNRTKILWGIAIFAFTLLFSGSILFGGSNFVLKLIYIAIVMYVGTAVVRFFFLDEQQHRKEYVSRAENDLEISMSNFWGIYRISDNNFCYFRNGWVGLFVQLDKGPTLGNSEEDSYNHYEAISDAYNIISSSKMRVVHIDLMDFIGRDNRIEKARKTMLANTEDTHLKSVVTRMYAHWLDMAETTRTSYDIYLFMFKGDEKAFEDDLGRVLGVFSEANYTSFNILTKRNIQTIAVSLFNLEEFSPRVAMRDSFKADKKGTAIVPIALVDGQGNEVERINLTRQEVLDEKKRKEAVAKAAKEERVRRAAERKQANKKSKGSTEADETNLDYLLIDAEQAFTMSFEDDSEPEIPEDSVQFLAPKGNSSPLDEVVFSFGAPVILEDNVEAPLIIEPTEPVILEPTQSKSVILDPEKEIRVPATESTVTVEEDDVPIFTVSPRGKRRRTG